MFYSDLFKSNSTNFPLNNNSNTPSLNTPQIKHKQQEEQESVKKNCQTESCSYWPQCGNCQNSPQQHQLNYEYLKSLPLKRKNLTHHFQQIKEEEQDTNPVTKDLKDNQTLIHHKGNISSVKININTDTILPDESHTTPSSSLNKRLPKSTTQWTLLCKNAKASTLPSKILNLESNTVVNVKTGKTATSPTSATLMTTKLTETTTGEMTETANTINTTTTITSPTEVTVTSLPHTSLILKPSASAPALVTYSSKTLSEIPTATTAVSQTQSTTITTLASSQQPRVIPLASTSMVFLGNFEMPITRERKSLTYYNEFNDIYETAAKTSLSSPASSTSAIAAVGTETSTTLNNNIENNVTYYEAKIHDNLKR